MENGSGRGGTPRVVIVGGGFGGLYAAKALRDAPVEVTLIDRRNHHVFQPLLYQVATAALSPGEIAVPIRAVLSRQRNATVYLAEARAIDRAGRRVVLTDDGEIGYDYLILAPGARHSYFGHDEWAAVAPGLKTIEDALEIRRRILIAFEAAEREADPAREAAWLNFVIVGGGPTGVELAGAIGEIARLTLAHDFRRIDPTRARILLVEAGPRILPAFPESLADSARRQLADLGVEVLTGRPVTAIDDRTVAIGEAVIPARTVIWAAGVQASGLIGTLGVPVDRAGRVTVDPDLSLPGHPEVFVIGDAAVFPHQNGRPLPGTAAVAVQQGRFVGQAIARRAAGLPVEHFRYRNQGNLATIGRAAAVCDFGRLRLTGLPAWLAWLTVHILLLIGFGNRLVVLIRWAWAYLRLQRGARLITGD